MCQIVVAVVIVHDHAVLRCHLLLDHEEELTLIRMLELDLIIVLIEYLLDLLIERTLFGKILIDDAFCCLDNNFSSLGKCHKRSIRQVDPYLGRYISRLLWFQSHCCKLLFRIILKLSLT